MAATLFVDAYIITLRGGITAQNTLTHDFLFVNASGEATGLPIVFRQDGYINMTKAAKAFGKKLVHFWSNKETDEYLLALASALGLIHRDSGVWSQSDVRDAQDALVVAKRGGRPGNAGTWCHPKLAVFFARWLDVRFAVWCDLMIDNILRGDIKTSVVVPNPNSSNVSDLNSTSRHPKSAW